MGADLKLVVPESEWEKELLKDYYEYKQSKKREIDPDRNWPAAEETLEYQIAVEELNQTLLILEQLSRDLRDAIDTESFYGLLGNATDRRILRGDKIDDLVEILRDAKQKLVKQGEAKQKAEIRIEAGPIALCEFAIEQGYGVRLSE